MRDRYETLVDYRRVPTSQPSFPISSSQPSYLILEADSEKGMRSTFIYPVEKGTQTEETSMPSNQFTQDLVNILDSIKNIELGQHSQRQPSCKRSSRRGESPFDTGANIISGITNE